MQGSTIAAIATAPCAGGIAVVRLSGALARKIGEQKDALTALQAHLAAWVDFPEEDVPELDEAHLRSVLGSHSVNENFSCYNYRATHWLDAQMTKTRFFEILDRCVDEAVRGYYQLAH